MIKRMLKQVEQMVNGTGLAEQYEGTIIQGVSIDTRKIEKRKLICSDSRGAFRWTCFCR